MVDTLTSFLGPTPAPTLDTIPIVISRRLSFATTNAAATNIVQALNIEKGTYLTEVLVRVVTAEGGVATVDAGDGDNPDGWLDGIDVNAAANTVYYSHTNAGTDEAFGKALGKFYTADDTIDLIINNALDVAVLDVIAIGYRPRLAAGE